MSERICLHCKQTESTHFLDDIEPYRALVCSSKYTDKKTYFAALMLGACEHENLGAATKRRVCPDCGCVIVYCHACSLAGGAQTGIYHGEPACPTNERTIH